MIRDVPQRLSEGERFLAQGSLDAAANVYHQVLSNNPNDAEALHLLGLTTLQQGQIAFAIRCLGQAVQLSPENALFHQDLGKALMAANDRVNAERCFNNAAQINANLYDTWFELGNTYLDSGKADEALNAFYRALELNEISAGLHYNIGLGLLSRFRADEALAHFERAIELDPTFTAAYVNIGALLQMDKQHDAAERMFRRALEIDPTHSEGKMNLAELLVVRGKIAEAVDILVNLALDLQVQGQIDSATDIYYRLTQLQPREFDHWFHLGRMLRWQGATDAALSVYEHGMTLAPDNDQLLVELGLLHASKGEYKTAEHYLTQANNTSAADAEAVIHLVDLFLARGDNDAAYRSLMTAIEKAPDDAELHYRLGIARHQTGDFDGATADWRHALELNPEFAEAHMKLAHVNLVRGRFSQGWRHFEWRFALSGQELRHPQKPWQIMPRASSLNISDWREKKVLLLSENTLEETLFFARFLPLLCDYGAKPALIVEQKYLSLLSRIVGVEVMSQDQIAHERFDVVALLGDLPLLLKIDSFVDLPEPTKFVIDNVGVAQLRQKLQGDNKTALLGLGMHADLASQLGETAWQTLAKLIRHYKGEVVIFGLDTEQHRALQENIGRKLIDGSQAAGSRDDELLWLAAMDEMIVGNDFYLHLCAACAKKARVLVPHPSHWQWLLYSDESPWYPEYRLYRQNFLGGWDYALARLSRDLA